MGSPSEFLAGRIEAGDLPSASWIVGSGEAVLSSGATGDAVRIPSRVPAAEETVYDLASLTKPLVTSPLMLVLARHEGLHLDEPVRKLLSDFDRSDKREIRLDHLLTHTSGLPDWAPLYAAGGSIRDYVRRIAAMDPLERPGGRTRYSDLGYMVLGAVAEVVGGAPLQVLAGEILFGKSGSAAVFRPGADLLPRVAATEDSCNYERGKAGAAAAGYSGWRTGVIRGEVHDQNAWAAGGVAGHAGLFGTARDVYLLAREMLTGSAGVLTEEDRRRLIQVQTGALPEPRSLGLRVNRGMDGNSDPGTAAGEALPPEACGHNGFTGTSVWLDPRARKIFVLLTNRIHPEVREDVDMNAIRREFHRLAAVP